MLAGKHFVGAVMAEVPRQGKHDVDGSERLLGGTPVVPALADSLVSLCDKACQEQTDAGDDETPAPAAPAAAPAAGGGIRVGSGGIGIPGFMPSAQITQEAALTRLNNELAQLRSENADLLQLIEDLGGEKAGGAGPDDAAFDSPSRGEGQQQAGGAFGGGGGEDEDEEDDY